MQKKTTVFTDHKPLENLFNKPLHSVPARIQRMMLKIQKYDIEVKYKPGKEMVIADALSRAYLEKSTDEIDEDEELYNLENELICEIKATLPFSREKREKLVKETKEDETLVCLKKYIINGWPNDKKNADLLVRPFWNIRENLCLIDDLIFMNEAVVIPINMKKEILEKIHEGHLGLNLCINKSKNVVYWPGIYTDIKEMITSCQSCTLFRKNNSKEPLVTHEYPEIPWYKVGMDLFQFNGTDYLIIVDYYSKFFEISKLNNTSTNCVITQTKSIFSRHGIPAEIISDNGPQFSSALFKQFIEFYEIEHITTSPFYPQSNGMVERTIQTVKQILKKCLNDNTDPYLAILNYRNTSKYDSPSPAQLLFSRNLNCRIPVSKNYLKPKIYQRNTKFYENRQRAIQYYNRNAKNLKPLTIGQSVMFKKMPKGPWISGKIVEISDKPRSYFIEDLFGNIYRRNRINIQEDYTKNVTSCQKKQRCFTNNNSNRSRDEDESRDNFLEDLIQQDAYEDDEAVNDDYVEEEENENLEEDVCEDENSEDDETVNDDYVEEGEENENLESTVPNNENESSISNNENVYITRYGRVIKKRNLQ